MKELVENWTKLKIPSGELWKCSLPRDFIKCSRLQDFLWKDQQLPKLDPLARRLLVGTFRDGGRGGWGQHIYLSYCFLLSQTLCCLVGQSKTLYFLDIHWTLMIGLKNPARCSARTRWMVMPMEQWEIRIAQEGWLSSSGLDSSWCRGPCYEIKSEQSWREVLCCCRETGWRCRLWTGFQ